MNLIKMITFFFLATLLTFGKTCWAEDLVLKVRPEIGAVTVAVVNQSNQEQAIRLMSCSWWENWVFDNPRVMLNLGSVGCFKNVDYDVKLKPGDKYTRRLPIHISDQPDKQNRFSFKVGLRESQSIGDQFSVKYKKTKDQPIFWSRSINIEETYVWMRWEIWSCLFFIILGTFLYAKSGTKVAGIWMIIISIVTIVYFVRGLIWIFPDPFDFIFAILSWGIRGFR